MDVSPSVVVLRVGQKGVVDVVNFERRVGRGDMGHQEKTVVPVLSAVPHKGRDSLPDLITLEVDPSKSVHQLELGVEVFLQRQKCL